MITRQVKSDITPDCTIPNKVAKNRTLCQNLSTIGKFSTDLDAPSYFLNSSDSAVVINLGHKSQIQRNVG
ncbi:MAG: hypothetical protein ACRC8Y_01880 [Chroococcales cyanobacterium]